MTSSVFINSIPIRNIEFADNVENTIVSNGIKEEFIGISTVKVGREEILCEHSEPGIVKCNVTIDDARYDNIPFRLIVDKKAKSFVTLNKASLTNPQYGISESKAEVLEESKDVSIELENFDDSTQELLNELVEKNKIIENLKLEAVNYKLKQKQNKLIEEEKVINYLNEKIETALSEFKDNAKTLIKNYISNVDVTERQIKDQIKDQLKELEEKVLNPNSYEGNKLMLDAIKEIILETDTQAGGTINRFKEQLLEDIRKASEQQLRNHTRQMQRYAEMVSGGGSVAVQFANGGTMSGNLNVEAQYLSGGKDLIDVFASKYVINPINSPLINVGENITVFEPLSQPTSFQYSEFGAGKTLTAFFSASHPETTMRHFLPIPAYVSGPAGEANTFFTHINKVTKLTLTLVNGVYVGETEIIDTTETQIIRPIGDALLQEDITFILLEGGGALLLE